jgi:putative type-1 restriction enzyme hindVIIP specificity protein
MSDWQMVTLEDVTESINTGLDAIRRAPIVEHKTNLRCLRIQDISQNKSFDKWGYTEVKDTDFKKFQLVPNDIIMARTCSTGICYLVKEELPAVFNNGLARIRLKIEKVDPQFIYYVFKSKHFSGYIDGISGGTSVQLNMKIGDLSKYQFKLPPLSEQKEIARILSDLDKKIELNTQINQTLEQIAQALFKSWFVDFDPVRAKVQALSDGLSLEQAELSAMQAISGKTPEELTALSQTQPDRYAELAETAKAFPCEMVEVDGVEVPKGWEYKPADELFDIGIGKTPPRKETEWFSTNPDDMQWISIKDMGNSGVFITESSEFLTNQAVDKFNIRKIPENTVLLSFKLTIGRVSITTCETTTNEAIAHFKITDKSFLTTEYLYLFFQQFDFNSLGSTSSIATAVNSKTIKGIEILIPNEELIKAFQMKISNIFAQIKNLTMENKNLVETRDLLLPKLLNGEI